MTRRRRNGAEAGFTLVEMLVALAVLGLILGLLGGAAKLLRGTGDRLAERAAALGDLGLVADLLQERLGAAVALDVGPPGRWVTAFDGQPDRVRFSTMAADWAPGEPLVAMAIGRAETGGLVLWRAELAADSPGFGLLDLEERVERRLLAPDVLDLRLGYFGRKAGEATATWHPTWQAERRLPEAVRLELDHRRLDLAPIIVPIRQSLGPLCATPEPGPECDGG